MWRAGGKGELSIRPEETTTGKFVRDAYWRGVMEMRNFRAVLPFGPQQIIPPG